MAQNHSRNWLPQLFVLFNDAVRTAVELFSMLRQTNMISPFLSTMQSPSRHSPEFGRKKRGTPPAIALVFHLLL